MSRFSAVEYLISLTMPVAANKFKEFEIKLKHISFHINCKHIKYIRVTATNLTNVIYNNRQNDLVIIERFEATKNWIVKLTSVQFSSVLS
jgi:hypothetical protein